MTDTLEPRRKEFWEFVWDHSADEFQAKFDECPALAPRTVTWLRRLLAPSNRVSEKQFADSIGVAVVEHPEHLRKFIQLLGLTRSKILQEPV